MASTFFLAGGAPQDFLLSWSTQTTLGWQEYIHNRVVCIKTSNHTPQPKPFVLLAEVHTDIMRLEKRYHTTWSTFLDIHTSKNVPASQGGAIEHKGREYGFAFQTTLHRSRYRSFGYRPYD